MPRRYGAGSVFPQTRVDPATGERVETGRYIGQWSGGRDELGLRIRGTVVADSESAAWKAIGNARGKSSSTKRRHGESVGAFLERWLEDVVRVKRKERTYWGYRSIVDNHLAPAFGETPLSQLSRREVQTWVARHELSPLTVRHHVDCLRSALGYAVRWGLIPTNPAMGLDLPAVNRRVVRAVDQEAATRLLAAFEGSELAPIVTVAIYTGLRQGELLALRWEDVNLRTPSVTVHNSLTRLPGTRGTRFVLTSPKSASSRRTVPLIPEAAEALRGVRAAQMSGDLPNPRGLVFGRPDRRRTEMVPLDGTRVTAHFQAHLRATGLPPMRWHDLRHATASMLIAAGVPLAVISAILGHSGIAITVDTYGHLTDESKRAAMRKLGSPLLHMAEEVAEVG